MMTNDKALAVDEINFVMALSLWVALSFHPNNEGTAVKNG